MIDKNDVFYVCALIEYIGRVTENHRSDVVKALGVEGIRKQLHDAGADHCLSFEQVSDEVCEYYGIGKGDFDTVKRCKYTLPGFQDIGKLYSIIALACVKEEKIAEEIYSLFSSFISDAISNFNSDLYYQNPDYLKCSYEAGELLD